MKLGLLLMILCLAGCQEHYTWSQKTTVIIETPDGPKSGAGVVEVSLRIIKRETVSGGFLKWTYWGEAAVVDLGDGKFVFALLNRPRTGSWQPDVLLRTAFARVGATPHLGRDNGRVWYRSLNWHGAPVELIAREYPALVAFRDITKPSTIVELESEADFKSLFGPGFRLLSVRLEIVDEPNTPPTVAEVLPWLPRMRGYFTNFGNPCQTPCPGKGRYQPDPPFGDFVGPSHFIQEPK